MGQELGQLHSVSVAAAAARPLEGVGAPFVGLEPSPDHGVNPRHLTTIGEKSEVYCVALYDLIATLPRTGGHLTAETIGAWITTHPIVGTEPFFSPLEHVDGGPHAAFGR
jgi:hypothetical protein